MHPPTTSTSYSNYDSLMGSVAIPGDEADADSSRNSQLRAAPNSAGKRAQRRLFASTNDVHSPEHLQRLLTWIETKGEESGGEESGGSKTEEKKNDDVSVGSLSLLLTQEQRIVLKDEIAAVNGRIGELGDTAKAT